MSKPRYEEKNESTHPGLSTGATPESISHSKKRNGGKTAWYWCNQGKHISNKEMEEKLLSTGSTLESIS